MTSANTSIAINDSDGTSLENSVQKNIRRRKIYWGIAYTVNVCITGLIFGLLGGLGDDTMWNNLKKGEEKSSGDYCEAARFDNFLREPANSISNLGFIFFGQMEVFFGFYDWNIHQYLKNVSNFCDYARKYHYNEHNSLVEQRPWWSIFSQGRSIASFSPARI